MPGAAERQYLAPAPVLVHPGVTEWLRRECRGIVLLTHNPVEAQRILPQCATIETEEEAPAIEQRGLLSASMPI